MLIRLANEGFSQNGTTFYSFEWTMMCYLISFSINVRLIFSGIVLWVKISVKSFNVFFSRIVLPSKTSDLLKQLKIV